MARKKQLNLVESKITLEKVNSNASNHGQNRSKLELQNESYPRLVADIGGTNARFAIETQMHVYKNPKVLACKNYTSIAHAIKSYLQKTNFEDKVRYGAIAIPTPEVGDTTFMVNSPWPPFSLKQTTKDAGLDKIIYLNDFHALALSVPFVDKKDLVQLGGTDAPDMAKPMAIIGPGTGLGMATLIKHPIGEYYTIPAEGGRSSFPPVNQEEIELWEFAHKRFSHVSAERFISGPGIQLIYEGLCSINNINIKRLPSPAEITEYGINAKSWICQRTIDMFIGMLGTVSSNLAVITNSFGGVYIGGGIVPKMLDYFMTSNFRSRFEDKGRYRPFLAKMPVYIITNEFPAFLGASYALNVYLEKGYVP
jgi:glucokinase